MFEKGQGYKLGCKENVYNSLISNVGAQQQTLVLAVTIKNPEGL